VCLSRRAAAEGDRERKLSERDARLAADEDALAEQVFGFGAWLSE